MSKATCLVMFSPKPELRILAGAAALGRRSKHLTFHTQLGTAGGELRWIHGQNWYSFLSERRKSVTCMGFYSQELSMLPVFYGNLHRLPIGFDEPHRALWARGKFLTRKIRWWMGACPRIHSTNHPCWPTKSGWWFGTFLIFPYIGNNHPNWQIFFRGVAQPPTRPILTNEMLRVHCSLQGPDRDDEQDLPARFSGLRWPIVDHLVEDTIGDKQIGDIIYQYFWG